MRKLFFALALLIPAVALAQTTIFPKDEGFVPPSGISDFTGQVSATEGFDVETDAGSKPTCDASNTGRIWYTDNSGTVDDDFEVCIEENGGSFAWTDAIGAGGGAHASTHSENQSDEIFVEDLGATSNDTSAALRPDGTGGLAFSDIAHSDLTGVTSDQHHAQLHASSHSDGAGDEVTVENLASSDTTTTNCLRPDGAGGLTFTGSTCGTGNGTIDGSGAANQLAYFTDIDTLSSDSMFNVDAAADEISFGASAVSPVATVHINDGVAPDTDFTSVYSIVSSDLVITDNGEYAGISLSSAGSTSPNLEGGRVDFHRSRGTINTPATIVNGDMIGGLFFTAHDGTSLEGGAQMIVESNGAVSTAVVPSQIRFTTTATNSASLTDVLILEPDQDVSIPNGNLDVGAGNITLSGTVDGVDVSAHAANADAHHASFTGPVSSTDNGIVTYNGTTGDVVQDTLVTIDDNDTADFQGIKVEIDSFTATTNAIPTSGVYLLDCDANANAVELDLGSAATYGSGYSIVVKVTDVTGGSCTIDPSGTETIDGVSTTVTCADQHDMLSLVSDGTNWLKIGSIGCND